MRMIQESDNDTDDYSFLIDMIHAIYELKIVNIYTYFVEVNTFENNYTVHPYIKIVTYIGKK